MNLGQRVVDLTAASPFTGAGMSLVTALVALAVLVLLRRMPPPRTATAVAVRRKTCVPASVIPTAKRGV